MHAGGDSDASSNATLDNYQKGKVSQTGSRWAGLQTYINSLVRDGGASHDKQTHVRMGDLACGQSLADELAIQDEAHRTCDRHGAPQACANARRA